MSIRRHLEILIKKKKKRRKNYLCIIQVFNAYKTSFLIANNISLKKYISKVVCFATICLVLFFYDRKTLINFHIFVLFSEIVLKKVTRVIIFYNGS